MTDEAMFRVKVDAKRRPTLPQALLDAAGVGGGQDLIAHLEEPGRIVLEAPGAVLARLQEAVRAGKQQRQEEAGDVDADASTAPEAEPGGHR